MKFERDNCGLLFKNDRKTEPHHSDYRGEAKIAGQEMWMNAWLRDDKNGKKYMSFSFKPKQAQRETEPEFDDEVPF